MNYPLRKANKEGTRLEPQHSLYSNEYAERMCDLHLRDEIHRDGNGKLQKYYRLHARNAHTEEQAFAYDIKCPHCYSMLKQVGRQETYTELGLYTCPSCNRY